jgi:hypothetical protein
MSDTVDQVARKKTDIDNRVSADRAIKAARTAQEDLNNPDRDAVIARGAEAMNKLSQKELEMMANNDTGTFDYVSASINANTFEKMMDNDSFNPRQKSKMLEERRDAIKEIIKEGRTVLTENLQNMSIKQIETMGDDFIRTNVHLFSHTQMDDVKKSKSFTEGQKGSYISTRKVNQTNPANRDVLFGHNTTGNTASYSKPRKAVDIAHLPIETFINPSTEIPYANNIAQVDGGVLEEIFNKKTMSVEQRKDLKTAVLSMGTQSAKDYLSSSQGQRNWS